VGIVSNSELIISGVYLALGLIYLRFWWAERPRLSYLAFTISCLSFTGFSWFELGMIHAASPEEYLFHAWWAFIVGSIGLVGFAWFVYLHLHGRKWLFLTYAAMRGLALIVHLIMANGANFREITSVGHTTILGETLSYPISIPNPWMVIPHASHLLLVIFFFDSSIRLWRRGEHRQALTFGTGTILFATTVLAFSIGSLWGLAPIPSTASFAVLWIIAPVLYELNYNMHRAAMAETRAAELGGQLTEIVASVPGVVWESRAEPGAKARKTTFISGYVQKLLGYTPEEWIREQPGLQVVSEEDRERVVRESDDVIKSGMEAVSEFRWITKDGRIRWVENHLSPIIDQEAGIVGLRGVALDVTERRTAQQALRESESFNRTILSSLNTHVCVLDREGRIISVNHAWASFALENGLASEASVGPGVSYLDVCGKAAEGAELAQVALDGVKAVCDGTREYFQLEYPCHSPTEKRWFLMTVTPLKGDKGGAVVVHNDITDRELAAEAARESRARLAETLDQLQLSASAANVGMWTRKVGDDEMWVSEKAAEIWGFSEEDEFTREKLFQKMDPTDREIVLTSVRDVEAGKSEFELEYRILQKDGNVRWIYTRGEGASLNGDRIIRGAIVDITKQKIAEARLTETLDQLQLSAAAGNVGMWTRRIGDETFWLSEQAAEIWDFPHGMKVTLEDLFLQIHPADRETFTTTIQEVEAGKNEYQMEYRFLSEDGSVRWIHSRGKVEKANGERVIRGAVVDITRLKMAEEAIRDLSGRLMSAQEEERARLARELHDDLSQRIAMLSVHLVGLKNDPKDLDFVKVRLESLASQVEQLIGDVHRISHELHPAMVAQLGLEAALGGLCSEFATAHSLKIDFEAKDLPRDLPQEISLCLYRITQESLQNVVKHSGAASTHVDVRSEGGEIHLSVSDNGNGFDTSATRTRETLGLISIDERVRAVKGHAKIVSAVGAGTSVEVHIPVNNNSDPGIIANSNIKIKNERITVVVAEDHRPMREAIVDILSPHFEIVGTAADGEAALEMINQLRPDLAVLDVSMPFKTGFEIAEDLKTSAPEVKVVIISAADDESHRRAAESAGVSAYVVKTDLVDALVPALKSA
jgi:PAS domain S-box-containing protein